MSVYVRRKKGNQSQASAAAGRADDSGTASSKAKGEGKRTE